jgi:hypothetical protein
MYTMIRPLSALALALLALAAADAYKPLYAEDAALGSFNLWLTVIAVSVGYSFLGSRVGRGGPFLAAFYALQAVALTAMLAAMVFAMRMVFVFGYRRIYREPMDAFEGFVEHTLRFLGKGLDGSFLLLLGGGGVTIGILLHALFWILEQRRLAR